MSRRYLCVAVVGVLAAAVALSATGGAASSVETWSEPQDHEFDEHELVRATRSPVAASQAFRRRGQEPTATCSGTAYSSFWVGLDGDTSNSVEQTGTDADCSGSTPQYYAWYEMYPKYPVNLRGTVRPGDKMTASVTTSGSGRFTLRSSDSTQGWTNTTNARLKSAKLASAEVIAEAPYISGGVLRLANFGTVELLRRQGQRRLAHQLDPRHRSDHDAPGSTVKAQPGSISSGSFSVTWRHS